ncbi:MAG TPA: penicillin-binding protein activator, partial [Gammaproteobacteria bacterium]|nr:penicillin-binding protein activator [Gammaproteobacteria bacterium]
MQASFNRFFRFTPLLLLLIVAGCALGPSAPSPEALAKAEALAAQNRNLAAAELYQQLGEAAADETRATLFIKAAEQYRRAMFPEKAIALLQRLNPAALPPTLQVDYAVVAARLDIQASNPRQALERLDFGIANLTIAQKRDVLGVRGRALYALGAPMDATRLLLQRAPLLDTEAARHDNQRMIWQGLSQAREPLSAATIPRDGKGRLLAGWVELGAIGQSAWESPQSLPALLDQWEARYPRHPASEFLLAEIRANFISRFQYPAQLALLLPLSGDYALQAEAVRDGFLAARYRSAAGDLPTVRVYDTGGTPTGVLHAFRQARTNGAQFVIGPLTKEGLQVLANLPTRGVPVLGLNYLEVPA